MICTTQILHQAIKSRLPKQFLHLLCVWATSLKDILFPEQPLFSPEFLHFSLKPPSLEPPGAESSAVVSCEQLCYTKLTGDSSWPLGTVGHLLPCVSSATREWFMNFLCLKWWINQAVSRGYLDSTKMPNTFPTEQPNAELGVTVTAQEHLRSSSSGMTLP